MPLHIDIRINDDLIERVHIARMRGLSTQDDSVHEYSVVVLPAEPHYTEGGMKRMVFPTEPTWLDWEEGIRFTHRYGDGAIVCVAKALQALNPALTEREAALQAELETVKAELKTLQNTLDKL